MVGNQNGCTALTLAVLKGHADCVRVLVEAGADKDATDNVCDNTCKFPCVVCLYAHCVKDVDIHHIAMWNEKLHYLQRPLLHQ